MPLDIGDGRRTAGGFDASSRPDRARTRARGIVRAAPDPEAMPTSRILRLAGRVLEAIWRGDADQFERLCTDSVSVTLTSAEHPSGVVRPSELLGVSSELSAIEVHLDHVLYVHPSIAVSFRIAARSTVSRTSDGRSPHDVTVSGALFGLVSADAFAELQLIRGSVLVPRGPGGDRGPVDRAVG